MTTFNKTTLTLLATLLALAPAWRADAQSDPIFTAAGFQQNHDYFSAAPGEHIDSNTGALVLTFTDLVLPGNNGSELRFQRTYNSKTGRWTFGIAGVPTRVRFDEIPPNSGAGVVMSARTAWTADGGAHYAIYSPPDCAGAGGCRYYQTKEFWLLDTIAHKVFMPDGVICTYVGERLAEIEDPFGNVVTIAVEGAYPLQKMVVRQYFDSQSGAFRKVEWPLPNTTDGLPPFMTYDDEYTWNYTWTNEGPDNDLVLRAVSPENTVWEYRTSRLLEVTSQTGALITSMTTPGGGTIAYEYRDHDTGIWRCLPQDPPTPECYIKTPVIIKRSTSGSLPAGEWSYTYPAWNDSTTPSRIYNPDGSIVELNYTTAGSAVDEHGTAIETQVEKRVVRRDGQPPIEIETRTYGNVAVTSLLPAPGFNAGSAVLTRIDRVRDGVTHTTIFHFGATNFGDFHRPSTTIESATSHPFVRTTTHVYTYAALNQAANGQPRILGKLGRETVSVSNVDDGTFVKEWTYDSRGFRRTEKLLGRTTTFTPDGDGNIAAEQNPNGHTTTYSYRWGVISRIETPEHTTEREINKEGTVHSETRGGRTTTFDYDDLFRVIQSTPPDGLPITTTYEADGSAVTVSRGPSWTKTTLDGMGRPTGTLNARNVATAIVYDAIGRTRKESLPFCVDPGCPGPVFVDLDYDDVGRVVFRENPDNTYSTNEYGPGYVVIRDENNHQTVQHWAAFGDSADARLLSVTDAANKSWHYAYNGLGKLIRVEDPDGAVRSWMYAGDTLVEEHHPESGTTHYEAYYPNGALKKKVDANGTLHEYVYDANERLTQMSAGDRVTRIAYEAGTDNRARVEVDGVVSTFSYDAGGRPSARLDQLPGDTAIYLQKFAYDGRDNLERITYASGRVVEYTYDEANRIIRIRDESRGVDYATGFKYHPSGAMLEYRAGNQLLHTFEYDANRYWPTRVKAGDLLDLSYSLYDGVGNVGVIGDSRPGMGQTLEYDSLYRLTRALGPYGEALYAYDPAGNRKTNVAASYSYVNGRLMTQNERTFTYDNNGTT